MKRDFLFGIIEIVFGVLIVVFANTANAAASQQGCESSGNTAAGCGNTTNTASNNNDINTTVRNEVNNVNINRTDAIGVGLGVGGGATQSQSAEGGSGGTASSGSSAGANANANNTGNQQQVTVSNTAPDKLRTVGQPAAIVTNTTANCRSAVGVNAGWLGGVFGFGTTVADETCQLIELSKRLEAVGLADPSIQIMCQDERAKKAMGSVCRE